MRAKLILGVVVGLLSLALASCTESTPAPTTTGDYEDVTNVDEEGNTTIDPTALSDALSQVSTDELSAEEAEGILYMREEEKLARDVYLTLHEKWEMPIFQNISSSEQTHTDAVKTLIDRYELDDPAAGKRYGRLRRYHAPGALRPTGRPRQPIIGRRLEGWCGHRGD